MGNTKIDRERKKEEVSFATIYYRDGGDCSLKMSISIWQFCPKLVRPRKNSD